VPDSVVRCCHIQKDSASVQLWLKTVLDVSGQDSNLVTSAMGFLETSLILPLT